MNRKNDILNFKKQLRTNPKFYPFNQRYDSNYIELYIQDNYGFLTEEDIQTAKSTKIFNQYYHRYYLDLKEKLKLFPIKEERLIEYLIEFTNFKLHFTNQESKGLHFKSLNEALMLRLPSSDLDIDGSLEACMDTLNHATNLVRVYYYETPSLPKDIHTNIQQEQLLSFISEFWHDINYYSAIKEWYDKIIWEEKGYCQWDESKKQILMKLENSDHAVLRYIGLYRLRNDVLAENFLFKELVDNPPEKVDIFSPFRQYRRGLVIESSFIQNGFIKYTLKEGGYTKKELHDLFFLVSGLSVYYEFIMNEQFPHLSNLSLKNLLSLMHELRTLVLSIKPNENDNREYIEYHFPSRIKIDDLEEYFLKQTIFSKEQIRKFMQLLIYSYSDKRYNFWDKLILMHHDYYVFPLLNIQAPNILYLIDVWLEAAQYDLKKRGELFEKYVRNTLSALLKEKGYTYKIVERRKFKVARSKEEEIDIILTTKHSVLIGDIKCIKHPLEARDYHNSYEKLKEGAKQVRDKTDFILQNKNIFGKDIGNIENKEIIQVVITNYPLFSGININGVLIIDFSLLDKYIDKGKFTVNAATHNGITTEESHIYYDNEDEFSKNLKKFLSDPPVIANIKNSFGMNTYKMKFDDTEIYAEFIELQENFLKQYGPSI